MNNLKSVAIILARGGSKEIKHKNLKKINGKSLLEITIHQIKKNLDINIFVSSDSNKILEEARRLRCYSIVRPKKLSGDDSSSEEGLLHAIQKIEKDVECDTVIFPQVTSPLRRFSDFPDALNMFEKNKNDSFTSNEASDLLIWSRSTNNKLSEINFDNNKRTNRQKKAEQIIENGSFYIFNKEMFKKYQKRLFGDIGYFKMQPWQMFEIDSLEDFELCSDISKIKKVDGIYE